MARENEKGIEKKEESKTCPKHGEVYYWYTTDDHYKCGKTSSMFFGAIEGVCGKKCGKIR